MNTSFTLRDALREIGTAIRQPDVLVLRWHDRGPEALQALIFVLLINAAFGTTVYGFTMQMHNGAAAMLRGGVLTTLAAGGAWLIALPSLYIVNSALGSKVKLSDSVLVASVTVCFGAWAMLASVPINWFFSLALPSPAIRLLINLTVFTGVGFCMTDVFLRCLYTLDPYASRSFGYLWILLLAIIGSELFALFGVFAF